MAEWVETLLASRSLKPNSIDLNVFLEERSVSWWPTAKVACFPALGTSESHICQPFVSARIDDLLNNGYTICEKNTFRLTSAYTKTDKKFVLCSEPVDSHAGVSFHNRKPDIPCYKVDSRGGCSITILGDVKGFSSKNKDFSNSEVGHILDMGKDLLTHEQFVRTLLYCFLTDGYRFQFFKCFRSHLGEDLNYEKSAVYCGERGWKV